MKITDEAIAAAVKLSSRYIADRFLPDKAIDLIDEAASRVRLHAYTAPPDLQEQEKKLKELEQEKASAVNAQEFERAASLRDKEKQLREELEEQKRLWEEKSPFVQYRRAGGHRADCFQLDWYPGGSANRRGKRAVAENGGYPSQKAGWTG